MCVHNLPDSSFVFERVVLHFCFLHLIKRVIGTLKRFFNVSKMQSLFVKLDPEKLFLRALQSGIKPKIFAVGPENTKLVYVSL